MATFGLIEYEDASPEVRMVYDDIMATRKTDWINNFWKALASDPALLEEHLGGHQATDGARRSGRGDEGTDLHRGERDYGMDRTAVDVHLVGPELAPAPRLGEADRIEHVERHAARGRGAGHLPLAGHRAGAAGARSRKSRAERRRADRRPVLAVSLMPAIVAAPFRRVPRSMGRACLLDDERAERLADRRQPLGDRLARPFDRPGGPRAPGADDDAEPVAAQGAWSSSRPRVPLGERSRSISRTGGFACATTAGAAP